MVRVIVAGSRNFTDFVLLDTTLKEHLWKLSSNPRDITIVSGAARGADQLGEEFAKIYGLNIARYPAEWQKYGKSAGYKRNEIMAKNADVLIAFWDGKSKGTEHMINLARKYGLKVIIVRF